MGRPDFQKLLDQSLQLSSYLDNQPYLIQRNVEQIDETSKKLAAKSARATTDVAKNKAYDT
jgi:hypothetical protein